MYYKRSEIYDSNTGFIVDITDILYSPKNGNYRIKFEIILPAFDDKNVAPLFLANDMYVPDNASNYHSIQFDKKRNAFVVSGSFYVAVVDKDKLRKAISDIRKQISEHIFNIVKKNINAVKKIDDVQEYLGTTVHKIDGLL